MEPPTLPGEEPCSKKNFLNLCFPTCRAGQYAGSHGSGTLLPMLQAQRTTAQGVGLWKICGQEEARALAPAQLGTYAMSGGLDTLSVRQPFT